jgi:hypothetical protein
MGPQLFEHQDLVSPELIAIAVVCHGIDSFLACHP